MNLKSLPAGIVLITTVLLFAVPGCSGSGKDDSGGNYACSWEERRTGCNNYNWTEWSADCYEFDADDYYITPEEVCANQTDDDPYCSATCCINYEFRNVSLTKGHCP